MGARKKKPDGQGSDFHFVIPSQFQRMREVQSALLDEIRRRDFNSESIFAIQLALEEGLSNAIKHGNKFDPGKTVTVDARITDKLFEITIQDQGQGFVRQDVPDPTADENIERASGRGVMLIEAYMTSVNYSDHGRKLRMTRKSGAKK